jgi:hypothetical protein
MPDETQRQEIPMAARFTKGDSIKSTNNITDKNPPGEVRTRSHTLKGGSTMPGMPGFIDTGASGQRGGNAQGGKTIAPKWPPKSRGSRESEIGHRGGGHEAKKLQRGGAGTQGGRSAWKGPKGGSGKMERLVGSVKTFTERGGKKSTMY